MLKGYYSFPTWRHFHFFQIIYQLLQSSSVFIFHKWIISKLHVECNITNKLLLIIWFIFFYIYLLIIVKKLLDFIKYRSSYQMKIMSFFSINLLFLHHIYFTIIIICKKSCSKIKQIRKNLLIPWKCNYNWIRVKYNIKKINYISIF